MRSARRDRRKGQARLIDALLTQARANDGRVAARAIAKRALDRVGLEPGTIALEVDGAGERALTQP